MPYAEFDEIRLHIRQQGSGPVALFIHGFPLDSTMWADQLAALSGDRRCVAVDLRGFGRSSPVNGAPLHMERHAADLAGVLDLVSEEQADIVGLSMGGYVALAFADAYPGRVRSLALVDTKATADSPEAKAGRDAGRVAGQRSRRSGEGAAAIHGRGLPIRDHRRLTRGYARSPRPDFDLVGDSGPGSGCRW